MKRLIILLIAVSNYTCTQSLRSQTSIETTNKTSNELLTFEEFLGFVKRHHPLVKQANLTLSIGEANLLKARGGFDPKIEVDYDRKKFKDIEYYDQLNSTFKIPTWYGIELKTNFEQNSGQFLDPSLLVPEEGLYSAGVSFSLAQGLLINERMASLKKAKIFLRQSQADRELLVNTIIANASNAYFEWLEASNEQLIYSHFLDNANERLQAIKRSVMEGDKPAIDTTEARITLQNRKLELEAAQLKFRKSSLKVSNYLWVDEVPLQLEEWVRPQFVTIENTSKSLNVNFIDTISVSITNHPKLKSLQVKIEGLQVQRRLDRNKLLPQVDLQYNFLSEEEDRVDGFSTANYKAFVNISFPLFLRKERGQLKLTNYRIQDIAFEQEVTTLTISNQISALNSEINSLDVQTKIIRTIIDDYQIMVQAEQRKFTLGESSLFLINSREQQLIDARLKENTLLIKQRKAIVTLFNVLGLVNLNLN